MRQRKGRRTGADPLAEDRVEAKVLERGIKRLLDHAVEAVDLVDEKDVTGREVQEDRAQGALVVDGGAGAHLDAHTQLVGDDVGERRLAKAGRSAQQHVLDRLAAPARCLEQDAEIFADLRLTDVLREQPWPKGQVVLLVVGAGVQDAVVIPHEIGGPVTGAAERIRKRHAQIS